MAVTRDDLVAVFPEFGDAATYPDAAVTFWLDQAGISLTDAVFGQQLSLATMLWVAHNLVLSRMGTTGGGVGSLAPATSKSVGGASKSMDPSLILSEGAGIWNGSLYGVRFYNLVRALATGPRYRASPRAAALAVSAGYPYIR